MRKGTKPRCQPLKPHTIQFYDREVLFLSDDRVFVAKICIQITEKLIQHVVNFHLRKKATILIDLGILQKNNIPREHSFPYLPPPSPRIPIFNIPLLSKSSIPDISFHDFTVEMALQRNHSVSSLLQLFCPASPADTNLEGS